MADWAVQVFELDPVLVFWGCPIWHVSDVAEDGEGLGTRREVLARSGPKVEHCEGNSYEEKNCRQHDKVCMLRLTQ